MKNSRIRSALTAGAVALVVVAILAAIILGITAHQKARASQLSDFRRDLNTVGFGLTSPKWEDEKKGKHTKSTLEAKVIVAGCQVEFERAEGEDATKPVIINGRKHRVERYEADEINIGKREVEIDGLHGWPTRSDVVTWLRKHRNKLSCFTG